MFTRGVGGEDKNSVAMGEPFLCPLSSGGVSASATLCRVGPPVWSGRRESASGMRSSNPARHRRTISYSARRSAHLWRSRLRLRLRNSHVKAEQSVMKLNRQLARN